MARRVLSRRACRSAASSSSRPALPDDRDQRLVLFAAAARSTTRRGTTRRRRASCSRSRARATSRTCCGCANIEKPLANFFASGILDLREKLGPFLWQFPPKFGFDARAARSVLRACCRARPSRRSRWRARRDARMKGRSRLAIDADRPLRHAVEIRHASFMTGEFVALLRKHDIGLVVADTAGKWPQMFDVTSDFVYVRLHGDMKIYTSGYSDARARRAGRGASAAGSATGATLRLLRQRRQGEGALRRAQPDAQARPALGSPERRDAATSAVFACTPPARACRASSTPTVRV